MNKTELVNAVAAAANLTKKDAAAAVSATLDAITASLGSGDKVQIDGFGTFEVRERAARVCKNPATGASVNVAACKVPSFKAGKSLKDTVNG